MIVLNMFVLIAYRANEAKWRWIFNRMLGTSLPFGIALNLFFSSLAWDGTCIGSLCGTRLTLSLHGVADLALFYRDFSVEYHSNGSIL